MGVSNIEWTDFTFNPWIGCSKLSPGCKFCYAEVETFPRARRGQGIETWGIHGNRILTSYANWKKVLSWQRQAKKDGVRRKVFCLSMGDVFEDWQGQMVNHKGEPLWFNDGLRYRDADGMPIFFTERGSDLDVPLTMAIARAELFRLIDMCPDLDWLLLTKRPENITRMWPKTDDGRVAMIRNNVWLGTSVEDQQRADERIPQLLYAAHLCKYTFLSCEPMLGPVDLWGARYKKPNGGQSGAVSHWKPSIDWVICGMESGHNKRPYDVQWAYALRDECEAAGAAFYMKQLDKVQPIPTDLFIRQFPNAA